MTHGGTQSSRQLVGARLKQLRLRRGIASANQLATRCAELGAPELTRDVIANLESSRREVSVDRLLILALACDVSPLDLLAPEASDTTPIAITQTIVVEPSVFSGWLIGQLPLPQSDPVAFAANAVHRVTTSPVQAGAEELVRSTITQQALYERTGTDAARLVEIRQAATRAFAQLRAAIEAGADQNELLKTLASAEASIERTTGH